MFIGIIFVVLGIMYFVWVISANAKLNKYNKKANELLKSEEYQEWLKVVTHPTGWLPFRSTLSENFLEWEHNLYHPRKPAHTVGHTIFFISMLLFCGGIWFGINSKNVHNYNIATTQAPVYQEFVDVEDDVFLSCGGYEKILGFNDTVLTQRASQNHWYYRFYHLFGDDWYKVPLVTFSNE